MPLTPDPLTGQPGELIERLGLALTAMSESSEEGFRFVSSLLTVKLHVGSSARRDGRDAYVAAVMARIRNGVEADFSEDTLVLGVRELITQTMRRQSTNFEGANASRARTRSEFERVLEDPFEMERFLEQARLSHPGEQLTEDKIREDLTSLLNGPLLKDVDADNASGWWSMEKSWVDSASLYLSDSDVREWIGLSVSPPQNN